MLFGNDKTIADRFEYSSIILYNRTMTDSAHEIEKLKAQIKVLEGRLDKMSTESTRGQNAARECDEALKKFIDLHRRYIDEAFDRIMNIEVKIFPNLLRDINQVHDIIGDGEDKAINPLDHRKK